LRKSIAGIAAEGGRIFIARRLPGGDMGGKWEFPGGKVEEGESDEEALIREYDEEFGVPIRIGALLGTASFEHQGCVCILNAYRIYFASRSFNLTEHTEWRWVSLKEIEKIDFVESDRKLIPALNLKLHL
jgi:8-oxo-dGTP diphosphatase